MNPKVIRNKSEYEAALSRIEILMDVKKGSPEEDELELWSILVERYEDTHHPIDPPDPIEAIKFRMDQEGLRPADLTRFIPSKSKVSEILNRKRPLSLSMIRSLHEGLGIPAEILVREPKANYGKSSRKGTGT